MEYLKLLSKIALSFQNLEEFEEKMNKTLADIGEYLDISRAYIFIQETEETLRNNFEWSNAGVSPRKQSLQKIQGDKLEPFGKILKEEGCICSSDVNDLPIDVTALLKLERIKSMVAYPLLVDQEMVGFIGFNECRQKREWKEEEVELLNTVSSMVTSAYQKRLYKKNLNVLEMDSLQSLTTIFQKNPLPIAILNAHDGTVSKINSEFIRKTGYSAHEMVGKTLQELNILIDSEKTKRIQKKQLNGEDVIAEEVWLRRKDGETMVAEVSVEKIVHQEKPSLLAVLVDITERVNLRTALKENNKKLTDIIDGTRAATWELDLITDTIECNDYWAVLLGYSLEELAPITVKRWDELTHPKDMAAAYKKLTKHITGEDEYYEHEMRLKHKEGHWVWMQSRGKITEVAPDGTPLKMFGTHLDISNRKKAEKRLRESEKRFILALDKTKAGLWDIDLIKQTMFLSPMWKEILGYSDDEIENNQNGWKELVHPADLDEINNAGKDFITGKIESYESISRFRHKDGSWRWLLIRGGILNNRDGLPARVIGTNLDVTKEHEQSLELERFFSVNLDLLCITNLKGDLVKTNQAWEEILGYSSEELQGRNFMDFVHPDDIQVTRESITELGENKEFIQVINRYITHDGSYRFIEWRANSYGDKVYAAARDITAQKQYEEEIIEISIRDSLTNVYNRRYIYDRAKEIMDEYINTNKVFSVCLIDIDDFKQINDTYGHQTGDYILQEFTKEISANLRPSDLLGRYGGEEFIIILNGADIEKSKVIIERILQIIQKKTFVFNENAITFTFSAGISTCTEIPSPTKSSSREIVNKLIDLADQRMYHAKRMGKNSVVLKI